MFIFRTIFQPWALSSDIPAAERDLFTYLYILLTKREVKMAGYCPIFMDRHEVEVQKDAKRERGQYPAILTELAWSIKNLLYGIPRLHVALCFYFCVCRFLLQNVFLKLINIFVFFVFILVDAFGFLVF